MSFVNFELFCTFFYCIFCWFRYVNASWHQHNTSLTPSNQIYLTLILYTYFVAILQGLRKQPSIFIIMMVSLYRVKIQHIRPCVWAGIGFSIWLFFCSLSRQAKVKVLQKLPFNLLVLVLAQAKVFTLVKSYFFNFFLFLEYFSFLLISFNSMLYR